MGLILKILNKYNLFVFLTNYTKNADFQGKSHCKRIVVNAVDQKHDNDWQTRINSDNDINQFREIHISVYIANAWKFPTNFFELRPAKFVVKLFSSLSNNNEDTEENTTEKTTLHRRLHNTKDNTTQSTILHMYKTQHYTKDYTTQNTTLHRRLHNTKHNTT